MSDDVSNGPPASQFIGGKGFENRPKGSDQEVDERQPIGPSLPEEDLGLLPVSYDEDRLTVVPRDPGWVFLVWDVTPPTLMAADDRVRSGRTVLRLHVTDEEGASSSSDFEIPENGDRYYAKLSTTGVFVSAELGRMGLDGGWSTMLRSGRVGLPVNRVRPGEAVFDTIPFNESLDGRKSRRQGRTTSIEGGGRLLTEAEFKRLFGDGVQGPSSTG